MAIENIKLIHEKENEIKERIEQIRELKRKEFLELDNFLKERAEEMKQRLSMDEKRLSDEKKKKVDHQIIDVEQETDSMLKQYDNIASNLIDEAKSFIQKNLFK